MVAEEVLVGLAGGGAGGGAGGLPHIPGAEYRGAQYEQCSSVSPQY